MTTTTELQNRRNLGKQMGCIAGFFQLFDRHHNLTGKRLRVPTRPHSSPIVDATSSESERSAASSPVIPGEIGKVKQSYYSTTSPSPEQPKPSSIRELQSPLGMFTQSPTKSPIPVPILELKEGSASPWKFWKEAPRLSLDSRATTDAKGGLHPKQFRSGASVQSTGDERESVATDESQQNRSPSVIGRLMGLEPFPDSDTSEPESKPQLRRSASESRVNQSLDARYSDQSKYSPKGFQRGSFNSPLLFDSGDFFPEPKHKVSLSLYEEIENRLKTRGVSDHGKDLENLKQILEALQFKGFLHSREPMEQNHGRCRNFVYDESPIVVMKPSRTPASTQLNQRMRNDHSPSNVTDQCGGLRQSYIAGTKSPRHDWNVWKIAGRGPSLMMRNEGNTGERQSKSPVKRKSLNVEMQRRINKSTENRGVASVQSPKRSLGRTRTDPTTNNKSPRTKKTMAGIQKEKIMTVVTTEDESSTPSISGSSITTSTDGEMQRSKAEDRNMLERCDKLIHGVGEMTSDVQPSPVSVLDSSLYKDEPLSPSPVATKRNLNFKEHSTYWPDDLEDRSCNLIYEEISGSEGDLMYISDILRATDYFPERYDVFLLLEKKQCVKGKEMSKLSRLQRKLMFDTVNEILVRNRLLPPWSVMITKPSLDKVWSEIQRLQEQNSAEDMFDMICGVLKKDLNWDAITEWRNNQTEMSAMILDIERLVFKDLITETVRDLVVVESISTSSSSVKLRRKLAF